jgi:hypothetical protein
MKRTKSATTNTKTASKPGQVKVTLLNPVERLWAYDLGDNKYKLDNAPISHPNMVYGDVVEAVMTKEHSEPVVNRVVEKSGNIAIGIIAPFKVEHEYREFIDNLKALGCVYEGMVGPLGVLTITPQLDRTAIDKELSRPEVIQTKPGPHLAQLGRMLSFAFPSA